VVYLESQTDSLYLEKLPEVERYRGQPGYRRTLSERRLAAMFAKTSRRWARNRIAEAAEGVAPATATQ
jgi:hypothetical protein